MLSSCVPPLLAHVLLTHHTRKYCNRYYCREEVNVKRDGRQETIADTTCTAQRVSVGMIPLSSTPFVSSEDNVRVAFHRFVPDQNDALSNAGEGPSTEAVQVAPQKITLKLRPSE